MKKLVALLLVLTVLAGISASAAPAEPDLTAYSVANGVVTSSVFDDITAPFSGTLSFFDLELKTSRGASKGNSLVISTR